MHHLRILLVLISSFFAIRTWGQMPVGSDTLYGMEWIVTNQPYFKVKVTQDGVYRLNYADLQAAGLPLTQTNGNQYQVFHLGKEIPIYVSSGALPIKNNDYLEFVATKNRGEMDLFLFERPETHQLNPKYSLISDTAAYFLTIVPSGTPTLRYQDQVNDWNNLPSKILTCRKTAAYVFSEQFNHTRYDFENLVAYSSYDMGEGFGSAFAAAKDLDFTLENLNAGNTPAQLTLRLCSNQAEFHRLRLRTLNNDAPNNPTGQWLLNDTLQRYELKAYAGQIAANGLARNLKLRIENLEGSGAAFTVAFAEIEYSADFGFNRASSARFQLEPQAQRSYYEITDFDGGLAPVLYLENTLTRVVLEPLSEGKYRFTLPPLAQKTSVLLFNPVKALAIFPPLRPVVFADYRNLDANYIIITHAKLRNDGQGRDYVEEYAAYRRSSQGGSYRVLIADVQQLFDQFGYGIPDHPQALRNFGAYLTKRIRPQYLFLIGHGIEYHLLRQRNADMRPEHYLPTFGTPGSDNLLFCPNGKLVSFIPTGRLAVLVPHQIGDYLDKVKEFDQRLEAPRNAQALAWRKRVLHISGGNLNGNEIATFQARLKRVGSVLANNDFGAIVNGVSKQSAEAVVLSTAEEVIKDVNAGVALKVFLGHGAVTNTDFGLDDPLLFNNAGHYPLIFSLGCLTGKLYDLQNSLSERFTLAPNRGGIAYIASSGFANDGALEFFLNQFYQALGGKNYLDGIGDMTSVARSGLGNINSFIFRSLGEQIILHGDPAIRMNRYKGPDFTPDLSSFRLVPNNPTVDQDSFEVRLAVLNLGQNNQDTLQVKLTRILPDGKELTYAIRLNARGFADTFKIKLPVLGKSALGKNRLFAVIDPLNRIAELPDPAAENNNRLLNSSGQEGLEFIVLPNDFVPLFPANFGIFTNNQSRPTLYASATNQDQEFKLEIDTTALFNSPSLQSARMKSTSSLLAWSPSLSWQNGRVYYWRMRSDTAQSVDAWKQSSFLFQPGSKNGWNQSHYFQLLETNLQQLNWDTERRKLLFQSKLNNIIAESVPYSPQTNSVPTRYLYNNSRIFRTVFVQGVVVAVFDPLTGQPWLNTDGQQRYGTLNQQDFGFIFETNTPEQRKKVIDFLENAIPKGHYVLFMTVKDAGQSFQVEKWAADSLTLGTNLFRVLERNGATLIREMASLGSLPYAFAYVKGAAPLAENLSVNPDLTALIRFDLPEKLRQGTMSYRRIGPAKSWKEVVWEAKSDSPRDSILWSIKALDASNKNSKLVYEGSSVPPQLSLTALDAQEYPYLELSATFQDSLLRTPAQLDYWRVYYDGLADAAIRLGTSALPDTIQQGQALKLSLPIYNLGTSGLDTMSLLLTFLDAQNRNTVQQFKIPAIAASDSFLLNALVDTRSFKGKYQIQVEANPGRNPVELNYQNNLAIRSFFVKTDAAAPVVDVTFDGLRILHKDLVSSSPLIQIMLRDENKYLLLSDTALFDVRVVPPKGAPILLRFNSGNVAFFPSEKPGQPARIEWQPQLFTDGEYQLIVRARDASGNLAGGNLFQVSFRIVQEQSLSQLLPYPNPFTTSCRFVYTLTGKEEPAYFAIQIMTVSGQVVKEINQDEFGDLRIGTHLSDYVWNGTDEYGDQLANGVYLYRVVAKDAQGKSIKLFSSAADPFFDKGFGKIVLLR